MTKRSESSPATDAVKKAKHSNILHDGDPTTEAQEAPFLKLFTAPTPNGQKVHILLELLQAEYIHRTLNIQAESKQDWYLKLNPNGKIPLLEDVDSEGNQLLLGESGAILLYLASKLDTEHKFSYAQDTPEYWKQVEFVLFHASGLNPDQKNYNVTKGAEPENAVAIERFRAGIERAYQLFEDTLQANGTGWVVGDHISVADIIAYPHAKGLVSSGFDVSKWPLFQEWVERVGAIPEVKAGMERQ